jgi:hypothetical protein
MTARYWLVCSFALISTTQAALSGDDPDVFLFSRNGSKSKWVWAVKQSRLSALPVWHETTEEVPLSPNRALVAAREFLRNRLGINDPRITAITLVPQGNHVWAYSILFDAEVPEEDSALLDVRVLMDGKVIEPVKQPVK